VGFGVSPLPTPEKGPLAGYGGVRDRKAEAVLDAPEARALVLDEGGLRIALVAVDLIIARPFLRDALAEEGKRHGIDSVLLVATHTHSGPGGYLEGFAAERMTAGSFDPEMPDRLIRAATRALARAVGDLRRVRVAAELGTTDLAENRREKEGPRETALPVLGLEDLSRTRRRVLFAYGAHATVLSPRSRAYSGDYPAAARRWLAEQGWEAVFVPGPLGDQKPRSPNGDLWPRDVSLQKAQVVEIGEKLGEAVLSTITTATSHRNVELAAIERWVELPRRRFRRFCTLWWLSPFVRGSVDSFLSPRVPFHALRVGDAVLLAVPAEPTSRVGERLRELLPTGQVPFVLAHANDWIGYVVDSERYRRGGYEACLSLHGSETADWLVKESAETLRELERRSSSDGSAYGGSLD
jgi:hypothetical protein